METIIGTALLLGMVFWVLKELFFEFSPSKIKEEGKSKKRPNEIERVRQFMDDRSKVREKEAREKAVQQPAEQIRELIFKWAEPQVAAFEELERQWKASQSIPFEEIPKGSKGKFIVYKISVADMIYIGFTSRPIEERIREHLELAKSDGGSKLQEYIRTWGFIFEHEIITSCIHEVDALHREMVEIQKIPLGNRLNISSDGEGAQVALYFDDKGNGKRLYGRIIDAPDPFAAISFIFNSSESLKEFKEQGLALEKLLWFLKFTCPTQNKFGFWHFDRKNSKLNLDDNIFEAIENLLSELFESDYFLDKPNLRVLPN